MASNETPESYDKILPMLEDAADGAATHGAGIGLKQNDETALRATLESAAGKPAGPGGIPPAIKGARASWNEKKEARATGRTTLGTARSNAKAVLSACVDILKPRLGKSWSNAWQAAGFTNSSIAIPSDPLPMLGEMRAYFESNPTHEKTNVAVGIDASAAACEAQIQALSTAQSASNQADTDASTAKLGYENAVAAARSRLTGLRQELAQLLGDDDPLWYAFGFDKPSDPETPEVPTGLVITPGGPGTHMLHIDWADARRAENYRLVLKNVATDLPVFEKICEDSEFTPTGLIGGMQVKVTVTARNKKGGESGPSAEVTATVP